MDDRGLLRFKDQAVAEIIWNSETHTVRGTVTDEKTGIVYQLGGGESDFSIAQVTFKNSLGTGERRGYYAAVPSIYENEVPGMTTEPIPILRNIDTIISIPLYKGVCIIDILSFTEWDQEITPVTTGNVRVTEGGLIEVTGNGSIDIAGQLGGIQ